MLALVYLLGTAGWMAHLARSKALREKTEYHGKAFVEHLRRYAEQQRQAARRG